MIQFNLLPDIKIQYLKAKHQKQLVMLTSGVVIVISLAALTILLAVVYGVQKKSISDLTADVTTKSNQLKSTPNLNKILTIQNQLNSLPALHDNKPVASRLFGYIQQVTPTSASITSLITDYSQHTMTLSGTADSLDTVTNFTEGLKFATYATAKAPKSSSKAFSNVVLSSYTRDSKSASFTINLQFQQALFSEAANVTLTVPAINARGNSSQATDLFKDAGQ